MIRCNTNIVPNYSFVEPVPEIFHVFKQEKVVTCKPPNEFNQTNLVSVVLDKSSKLVGNMHHVALVSTSYFLVQRLGVTED